MCSGTLARVAHRGARALLPRAWTEAHTSDPRQVPVGGCRSCVRRPGCSSPQEPPPPRGAGHAAPQAPSLASPLRSRDQGFASVMWPVQGCLGGELTPLWCDLSTRAVTAAPPTRLGLPRCWLT